MDVKVPFDTGGVGAKEIWVDAESELIVAFSSFSSSFSLLSPVLSPLC